MTNEEYRKGGYKAISPGTHLAAINAISAEIRGAIKDRPAANLNDAEVAIIALCAIRALVKEGIKIP